MTDNLNTKMVDDLRRKLDRLYSMKMQPSLLLSQRFDSIISDVDFGAERVMLDLSKSCKSMETARKHAEVNEARCEMVRILKQLESTFRSRLESRELGEEFANLEERVKQFGEMAGTREDDINSLEDLYVELVLEIIEMTRSEESIILENQTVFYLSSNDPLSFGKLIHLADVYLIQEQVDILKLHLDKQCWEEAKEHKRLEFIHTTTEQLFNRSLVVSVNLPFIVTKGMLAVKNLIDQLDNIAYPLVVVTGNQHQDYHVNTTKIEQMILENQIDKASFVNKKIEGLGQKVVNWTYFTDLSLDSNRITNLDSLFHSDLGHLTKLNLNNNRLTSLNEDILSSCKNLQSLHLENACNPDAKFSLSFLAPLSRTLKELSVTLSDGPLDFGVFEQMQSLQKLTICGAPALDSNRIPETLTKQHIAQISNYALEHLSLSHFNLSNLDQEVLEGYWKLRSLSLRSCRISSVHPNVFSHSLGALERLDLSSNRISQLTENMFAELTSLKSLNLNNNEISDVSSGCFSGLLMLHDLALRYNRIPSLPPQLFDQTPRLNRLSLTHNKLNNVSKQPFKRLVHLKHLHLDYNPIESIEDDAFSGCSILQTISLSHCQLKVIHSRMFTGLRWLASLFLDHNQIDSFQIKTDDGELIEIKSANMTPRELEAVRKHLFVDIYDPSLLKLASNRFTKLDLRVFGNLRSLGRLDLSSNKIDELNGQATEGMLAPNVQLDLSNNQLARVSQYSFPTRTYMNLTGNPIEKLRIGLPPSGNISKSIFGQAVVTALFGRSPGVGFKRIAHVDIDNRYQFLLLNLQSQAAAEGLFVDKKLVWETITDLALDNIPSTKINGLEIFSRCSHLRKLGLRRSMLDRVETRWLQSMTNLQTLSLQGNQIEALDDADLLSNCPHLTEIDLSANRLRSINRRLFYGLHKLKLLDLSGNPELYSIDDGLFRSLLSVKKIRLSGNNIKRLNLPRLFKSCRNLTHLDLSNNQLDNHTFSPENTSVLSNLTILLLSHNQLANIEFVRDMFQLQTLELKNNKIESIEKDGYNLLGRLRSLGHLDVSANRVGSLNNAMLAQLEHRLVEIYVSSNMFHVEPRR